MVTQFGWAQSTERSSWLDVLRGLAIFGVVAVHSMQMTDSLVLDNKSGFFSWLISLGRYGVELFFFLSGWLLVSIYGFNDKKLGKAYFARRMGRIYPLWIIFLLIAYVRWEFTTSGQLNSLFKPTEGLSDFLHSTAGVVILTLSFTLFISASLWNSVIPGGWSIQSEVAHYLLFPFIRKRSLNLVLKIVALINLFTFVGFMARPKMDALPSLLLRIFDAWIRLSIYSTMGFFLLGILCYALFCYLKESRINDLKFSDFKITHNTFIIFCISLLLVPCPFGNQMEAIGYLVVMILVSFGILRNKILCSMFRFIGKYAYFIYFMHFLTLESVDWIANKLNFTASQLGAQQLLFVLIFIFSLATSLILAIPSMKYFERPFIRLAHKVK